MDNNAMQSMTSTLGTQQSSQLPNSEPAPPQNNGQSTQEGASVAKTPSAGPPPAIPPVKRGPGRPKGSGVKAKFIDPNAPVVPKRPVGRPRKDGLPAGSVPRQPPSSTRKRKIAAPGTFAASGDSPQQLQMASASAPPYMGVPPYNYQPVPSTSNQMWPVSTGYSTLSAALQSEPPPRRTESLGPSATRATTIDPSLAQDDQWAELLQIDANALLQQLVTALQTPNPISPGHPKYSVAVFDIEDILAPNVARIFCFNIVLIDNPDAP
ncbi:hypothetical protein EWM64_g1274 [Hericium alpestre]|uniref:Uncharacterized protein n=1 Tax=Hericium alpestre TaxID=135208 RepID=A0A4Z0A6R3_9AGAM|nr:hypothetical protein EWM64_g1274 [Hericium alpestre]